MKTRNGFVSNSSSSSFIVSYDDSNYKVHKFFNYLLRTDELDTKMLSSSKEEIISEIKEKISNIEKEISKYIDQDPSKIISTFNHCINDVQTTIVVTVKQILEGLQKELQFETSLLEKIEQLGTFIAHFQLSYHNEILHEYMEDLINERSLTLIDSTEV